MTRVTCLFSEEKMAREICERRKSLRHGGRKLALQLPVTALQTFPETYTRDQPSRTDLASEQSKAWPQIMVGCEVSNSISISLPEMRMISRARSPMEIRLFAPEVQRADQLLLRQFLGPRSGSPSTMSLT